jgi:hypothetical protein
VDCLHLAQGAVYVRAVVNMVTELWIRGASFIGKLLASNGGIIHGSYVETKNKDN